MDCYGLQLCRKHFVHSQMLGTRMLILSWQWPRPMAFLLIVVVKLLVGYKWEIPRFGMKAQNVLVCLLFRCFLNSVAYCRENLKHLKSVLFEPTTDLHLVSIMAKALIFVSGIVGVAGSLV